MVAFNVVRFRVKPDHEQEFLAAHRELGLDGFNGARRFTIVKTGDGRYCIIGGWQSFDHIVGARPQMIGLLDRFRHCLEDLGAELGLTDPVSGEAVIDTVAAAPKARRSAGTRRKPANKARTTSARAGKPVKKKAAAKSTRKLAKKTGRKKAAKRKR